MYCKRLIHEGRRSDRVSHGICDPCMRKHHPEDADEAIGVLDGEEVDDEIE